MKTVCYPTLGALVSVAGLYLYTGAWASALLAGGIQLGVTWALQRIQGKRIGHEPAVIWFTGLSGSGKTTLSRELASRLRAQGHQVEQLDGDSLRDLLPATGFDRKSRDEHIRKAGLLACFLEKNGITVVASLISPYEDSRRFVRGLCKNFVEVHVNTPLEVCEKRDVKGLYKRARAGEIRNFTGIDDPYEAPSRPEITVDTSATPLNEALDRIESCLNHSGA
jgi:adenylylsulfate kinase